MSIIEKQGAVTRLATAIQNRMLKEPVFFSGYFECSSG